VELQQGHTSGSVDSDSGIVGSLFYTLF
jgi:hypothetical protein